jgi:hypothetical protein
VSRMNWARIEQERRDLREAKRATTGDAEEDPSPRRASNPPTICGRTMESSQQDSGERPQRQCPYCPSMVRVDRFDKHLRRTHLRAVDSKAVPPVRLPTQNAATPRPSEHKACIKEHVTVRQVSGPTSIPVRLSAAEANKLDRICRARSITPATLVGEVLSRWLRERS